jgi:hypothetical protein
LADAARGKSFKSLDDFKRDRGHQRPTEGRVFREWTASIDNTAASARAEAQRLVAPSCGLQGPSLRLRHAGCVAIAVFARCSTNSGPTFVPVDGQDVSKAKYNQIVTICRGRAASGVAMMPVMPSDPYAALADSISQGGGAKDIFNGCMAEYGFVKR